MKRTSYGLSVLAVTAALGSLSACGSSGSSSAALPAAPPSPAAATAAPAASTSPATTGSSTASGCPSGAGTSVAAPVTDATSARNALLAAVCSAPYDGTTDADTVISSAFQKVAPGLTPSLFGDSAATPTTISSSGNFQLDFGGATYDQLFTFGVTDGSTCAGGVAVIPQAAKYQSSDSQKPTVFAPVTVPSGTSCTAQAIQNLYRPGSYHS